MFKYYKNARKIKWEDLFLATQDSWRWCKKCQGLFYSATPNTMGFCPAGGSHDGSVSFNYVIPHDTNQGQSNWRWCKKCQGLFFAGNPTYGQCPAGGPHDGTDSFDYDLTGT